jgi:hypothetical protein
MENLLKTSLIMLLAISISCADETLSEVDIEKEENDTTETTTSDKIDISILASKFYNSSALTVTIKEESLVITSNNLPDHKSPYYATTNSLYVANDATQNPDFKQNPNKIESQNFVYTIPRYPAKASKSQTTPFGPMGISVNSVAFFNQNAAPGDDIMNELKTFDVYEGHPAQGGNYHYHIEPVWLTGSLGTDAFLGLLLDGFPVYGPVENGKRMTNTDLDAYHGHTSATKEFPNGIYHYHITDDLPWINGDGFYGTPGTITK